MAINQMYERRYFRFLDLWDIGDWKMKAYGITTKKSNPNVNLIAAARKTADDLLSDVAVDDHTYGIGYIGIHDGATSNFVFIDWWADDNELHHHVYTSPNDNPEDLKPADIETAKACVWDLHLMYFERNAWVKHVLSGQGAGGFEPYLYDRLIEEA